MVLIILPALILIGRLHHPHIVKLFHPHVRKIRFPGHQNLPAANLIDLFQPLYSSQFVEKLLVHHLPAVLPVLLFQSLIHQHHVHIHIIGYNGAGRLALQQGDQAEEQRQTGRQGQNHDSGFLFILCKLLLGQTPQDASPSRPAAALSSLAGTVAQGFYRGYGRRGPGRFLPCGKDRQCRQKHRQQYDPWMKGHPDTFLFSQIHTHGLHHRRDEPEGDTCPESQPSCGPCRGQDRKLPPHQMANLLPGHPHRLQQPVIPDISGNGKVHNIVD